MSTGSHESCVRELQAALNQAHCTAKWAAIRVRQCVTWASTSSPMHRQRLVS